MKCERYGIVGLLLMPILFFAAGCGGGEQQGEQQRPETVTEEVTKVVTVEETVAAPEATARRTEAETTVKEEAVTQEDAPEETLAAQYQYINAGDYGSSSESTSGGRLPQDEFGCVPQQRYVPEADGCVAIEGLPPGTDPIVVDPDTGQDLGPLSSFLGEPDAQYATESETTAPTSTGTQAVSCDGFVSAAGNPSQFGAQQFYDSATPEQQAALDADGDGFACDDLETGVDELGVTDANR